MNLPKEFCERMKALVGDEYDEFIQSYDTEIHRGIRINTLKCDNIEEIAAKLGAEEKVEWCESGFYIDKKKLSGNHPYHAAGMFYFQEPSAMAPAECMPVCEKAHILDLCAAPGGKTTHIGARMGNKGLLISNEIIAKRASILAENVERMGLRNTIVTNESPSKLADKFQDFFDGIIVDAPCSGEGMFRKEPQAVDEWSVAHTLSCGERQKNILDDAYKMLKDGGYLMYSTCTFSIDENERIVEYMCQKYGMEICDMPGLEMLSPGVGDCVGIEKTRRVFPHKQNGEGHYAALLQKKSCSDEADDCFYHSESKQEKLAVVPGKKGRKGSKIDNSISEAIKLYRDFEKKTLKVVLEGEFELFGDNLYLLPEKVDISKLKILRCGLHLGTIKRGRIEPSHMLSHALKAEEYKNTAEFTADDENLKKYMHGEVIPYEGSGWCVVTTEHNGIGWGKASGGMMKNHYPKALRTLY